MATWFLEERVLQWLTGGTASQRLVAIKSIMMVNHHALLGRAYPAVNHRMHHITVPTPLADLLLIDI